MSADVLLLRAELAQANARASKAAQDKETFVRLTACLCRAMIDKAQVAIVDGNVAVNMRDIAAVPTKYGVDVRVAELKKEGEADPNAVVERFLVVVVTDKGSNGVVKVEKPRLIL